MSTDIVFPATVPVTGSVITLGTVESANSLTFGSSYTLSGGGLSITSGGISVAPGTSTICNSMLSGPTGLTESGGGLLTLQGSNTFTGLISINGSTLCVTSPANLNLASPTNTLSLSNGGTLSVGANSTAIPQATAFGSGGGAFAADYGGMITLSGLVSGGAAGSTTITKTGFGELSIAAANGSANTFAGDINVSGGSLFFQSDSDLGTTSSNHEITLANGSDLEITGGTQTIGATRFFNFPQGGRLAAAQQGYTGEAVSFSTAGQISSAGQLTFDEDAGVSAQLNLDAANPGISGSVLLYNVQLNAEATGALGTAPVTVDSGFLRLDASGAVDNTITVDSGFLSYRAAGAAGGHQINVNGGFLFLSTNSTGNDNFYVAGESELDIANLASGVLTRGSNLTLVKGAELYQESRVGFNNSGVIGNLGTANDLLWGSGVSDNVTVGMSGGTTPWEGIGLSTLPSSTITAVSNFIISGPYTGGSEATSIGDGSAGSVINVVASSPVTAFIENRVIFDSPSFNLSNVTVSVTSGGYLQTYLPSTLSNSAGLNIQAGGTVQIDAAETIPSLSGAGELDLVGSPLTISGSSVSTFSGTLGFGNGSPITLAGSGSLTLSGNSPGFSGSFTVKSGTLLLSGDGNLGVPSNYLFLNGGTLGPAANLSSVYISNPIDVTGSGGSANVPANTTLNLAGSVSTGGLLTKTGAGNLLISKPNTLSHGLLVSGGEVSGTALSLQGNSTIANSGTLDGTVSLTNGTLVLNSGGSLQGNFSVDGGAASVDPGGTCNVNSLTVTANSLTAQGGVAAVPVTIGAGGLTMAGGSINLNADVSNPATILLHGDLYTAAGSGTSPLATGPVNAGQIAGTVDLGGGVRMFDIGAGSQLNISARIIDGTLVKAGDGTMVDSSSASNFSGGITVQDGTLQLSAASPFSGGVRLLADGPSFGTLSVDSDAELGVASNNLTIAGGTLLATSTFSTVRVVTLGDTTGNGNGTFSVNPGDVLALNNAVNGLTGLIKQGSGTLTLNGSLSYGGATEVMAGTLMLGPGITLPAQSVVNVAPGAMLDLGNQSRTMAALQDALLANESRAGGTISIESAALTVGSLGASTSFSGNINGSTGGSIVMDGAGSMTLSGPMTGFTGGINVSEGTLVLVNPSNTYTGTVNIAGGGLQVTCDGALGNAANAIALSHGGTIEATASFSTARNVSVLSGGGNIGVAVSDTLIDSGSITGSSALTVSGTKLIPGMTVGSGTLDLTAAGTFNGPLTIDGCSTPSGSESVTLLLNGNGTLPLVSSISLLREGTLSVDDSATITSGRLDSGASLNLYGGTLEITGPADAVADESLNALDVDQGTSLIDLIDGSGGSVDLTFASYARDPGSILDFEFSSSDRVYITGMAGGSIPGATLIEGGQMGHAAYSLTQGVVFFGSSTPAIESPLAVSVPDPSTSITAAVALSILLRRGVRRRIID